MRSLLLAASLLLFACGNDLPDGITDPPQTPGEGPRVIFDLDRKPLPEIPLPNDVATRVDPTSPTGRRVNLSILAPTRLEQDVRRKGNELDGFATFGSISVAFDAPLDLQVLIDRHQANLDFEDDAVFLLNVEPGSPNYGRAWPLDFGRGNFPVNISRRRCLFPGDPRCDANNLMFETRDEDTNRNGRLDPGEDSDSDGVLDKPNAIDPSLPVDDAIIGFYEFETNTLLIRPIIPLDPGARHAVVLTQRLLGQNGDPVRSPFVHVNHTRQNKALATTPALLEQNYGVAPDEIAFAWSFTTQSSNLVLDTIRAGLYGSGPMAWLNDDYPARLDKVLPIKDRGDNVYIASIDQNTSTFELFAALLLGDNEAVIQGLLSELAYVDYLIAGEITIPYFLADTDGLVDAAPEGSYWDNPYLLDDDESFDVDPLTGEAFQKAAPLDFLCTVPKATDGHEAPFPVVFLIHGTGVGKFSLLAFAGGFARFGIATCGIDGLAHGLGVDSETRNLAKTVLAGSNLGNLLPLLVGKRVRDLDLDGEVDVAGDFWTVDAFHSRDAIRQTALDNTVLMRVLRTFDGRPWSDAVQAESPQGVGSIAGDWNGDGIVDLGGPNVNYFAFGMSLGGIVTAVMGGMEPDLTAVSPEVGGGGLSDVAMRSTQAGVPQMVVLPLLGPLFVGEPTSEDLDGDGLNETRIYLHAGRFFQTIDIPVGRIPRLEPGDQVILRNLTSGEEDTVTVPPDGNFQIGVQAWSKNLLEIGYDYLPEGPKPMPSVPCTEAPRDGSTAPCIRDTVPLGDELSLTFVSRGETTTWDTFNADTPYGGVVYAEGAPFIALQSGYGYTRQTPNLRRFAQISQTLLDQGDPINYTPRYRVRDWEGGIVPALFTSAIGDTNVPIATQIAMARAGGAVPWQPGTLGESSPNDALIENWVVEGLTRTQRFDPPLFDPDDLDLGTDGHDAVSPEEPFRFTVADGEKLSGIRFFYPGRGGGHSFEATRPDRDFNFELFMINMVAAYFESGGTVIREDLCLATASCPDIPTAPE